MRRIYVNTVFTFISVLLAFSCVRNEMDTVPIPSGNDGEPKKQRISLNMSMEQPLTRSSSGICEYLGVSDGDVDGLSMEVSRLAKPLYDEIPGTKGEALRTGLPSKLWFNIYDEDDDVLWNDTVSNTNGKWLTENAYYLNPEHTYRFFVSSFDDGLSSSSRTVPNGDEFKDSVSGALYDSFTKDDLVGIYEHEGGTASSAYDVMMRHIYSAVFFRFSGDGPTGAKIKSVSLRYVNNNGTLNFDADGVSWNSYQSTPLHIENTVNYTISNGTSYSFPSLGPTYVCSNSVTNSTYLRVELEYIGKTFNLTKNLSDEEWLPGYEYTYQFKFSRFTDTSNYYLELTPSSASVDVGGSVRFDASLKFVRDGVVYTVPDGPTDVSWVSSWSGVSLDDYSSYVSNSTQADFNTSDVGSAYVACSCKYNGTTYQTAYYPNSALVTVNDYLVNESLTIDSFTYSPNPHDASAGTMSPTVTYTHTKEYWSGYVEESHDDAVLSYSITGANGFSVDSETGELTVSANSGESRSATVTVSVSFADCDCFASEECVVYQDADAIRYYGKPVLTGTLTYEPNPMSASGESSLPVTSALSYIQTAYWYSGKETTINNEGGAWVFSMAASDGFTLDSTSTGQITTVENTSDSYRSTLAYVKVSANGIVSSNYIYCTVSQKPVTYSSELVVSRDKDLAWVGESVQLTATLKTLRNGVEISSVDVTSDVTWSKLDGYTTLSVHADGEVTAESYGLAEFIATYDDDIESNSVTVIFNQRTLQLTPDGGSYMLPQGNRISFKNTGAVKQVSYVYDSDDEEFKTIIGSNVGYNSCTWTVANENILAKVSAGVFEGKKVGTTSVSVTFGAYKGNVNVTVLRKVDNN